MHIALAHGAVYRNFMENFSELGLTQRQVTFLWLVDDYPGVSQTDIAQLLDMDRATTMAIINRLQARHFIVRGQSTSDRRRQTLKLTRAGKAALEESKRVIEVHEEWLKSRFNAKELKTLVDLLKRVHKHV